MLDGGMLITQKMTTTQISAGNKYFILMNVYPFQFSFWMGELSWIWTLLVMAGFLKNILITISIKKIIHFRWIRKLDFHNPTFAIGLLVNYFRIAFQFFIELNYFS